MTNYQEMIVKLAGATVEEAPLVEGMMRLDYELDELSNEAFVAAARRTLLQVKDDTKLAREVAQSFGLVR